MADDFFGPPLDLPEDVPAEIQTDGQVTEDNTGEQVADEAGNPAWWDDNYPGQTVQNPNTVTENVFDPRQEVQESVFNPAAAVPDPYLGLTPDQIKNLGGADPTDPYIRARLGIPQLPGSPLSSLPSTSNFFNSLTSVASSVTPAVQKAVSALTTKTPVASPYPSTTLVPKSTSALTSKAASPTQDAYGLTILNAAQTQQLTRNVNPAFINSLTDPNTPQSVTDTNAVTTSAVAVDTNQNGEGIGNIYDDGFGGYVNGDGQPVDANGLLIPTGTANPAPVNTQDGQAYGDVFPDPNGSGGFVNANGDPVNPDGSPIPPVNRFSNGAIPVDPTTLEGYGVNEVGATGAIFGLNPDAEAEAAAAAQVGRQLAQQQAVLQAQKRIPNDSDWRVRLSLAPAANYLYKDPRQPGILWPLALTDGVVFPYTPRIEMAYKADYESYSLTHSNYKGYFYKSSYTDAVNMFATFTAQDTTEAQYLLAVIHFFRSVTKMFYGQDAERGAPPPLVYLTGLGEYQFTRHPCLVSSFSYNLPNDVDYIRARSVNVNGADLLTRRQRQDLPTNPISGAVARLQNLFSSQGINKGAIDYPPAPPTLGQNQPTYVPTKMDISISLLPVQSRQQVSRVFSLRQYANGDQLKGGFW